MIYEPPPFQGLNVRIPIVIPFKERIYQFYQLGVCISLFSVLFEGPMRVSAKVKLESPLVRMKALHRTRWG